MHEPVSGLVSDVLLHIPHASAVIPPERRSKFALADAELQQELLKVTDWFTDDLFELDGTERLVFGVSRLLVDPERFVDDAQEVMAARGLGAVYTRTHDGKPLKDDEDRTELLTAFYTPHHRALNSWAANALETHGRCLIIDCHSFPSQPLACDLDQTPGRPDWCIGSVEFHTPTSLVRAAIDAIEALDSGDESNRSSVLENRPYAGCIVPADSYGRDPRVCSIMIEVNRALYMDEKSGKRLAGFDGFKAEIRKVLQSVVMAWRDEDLAREIWEKVDLETGIEPIKLAFERAEPGRVVAALQGREDDDSWDLPKEWLFATASLNAPAGIQGLVEFIRDDSRVPAYTCNWVVKTIREKLRKFEQTTFSESTRIGGGEYAIDVASYFVPGHGGFRLEFIGDDEIKLHEIELGDLSEEQAAKWLSATGSDRSPEWFDEEEDQV